MNFYQNNHHHCAVLRSCFFYSSRINLQFQNCSWSKRSCCRPTFDPFHINIKNLAFNKAPPTSSESGHLHVHTMKLKPPALMGPDRVDNEKTPCRSLQMHHFENNNDYLVSNGFMYQTADASLCCSSFVLWVSSTFFYFSSGPLVLP